MTRNVPDFFDAVVIWPTKSNILVRRAYPTSFSIVLLNLV